MALNTNQPTSTLVPFSMTRERRHDISKHLHLNLRISDPMSSSLYILLFTVLTIYIINSTLTRYKLKEITDTRLLGSPSQWPGGYYFQVVKFLLNGRAVLRDAYTQVNARTSLVPRLKSPPPNRKAHQNSIQNPRNERLAYRHLRKRTWDGKRCHQSFR